MLFFLGAILAGGTKLSSQETGQDSSGSLSSPTPIPKTYAAAEVPGTDRHVGSRIWRAVVTGTGTFPFAYFYTNFIFDSVRFASNGFDTQYAPWPLKTQYSAGVSSGETFVRLGVSLGMCAVVGILDALIQRK